jgi:hypothetical protein
MIADDFEDSISCEVEKLNYEWFLLKETNFQKDIRFDIKKGIIYHIIKTQSSINDKLDEDGTPYTDTYEETEEEVRIDLQKYCRCYLPIDEATSWGTFEFDELFSNNTLEVAWDISNMLYKFCFSNTDVVAKHKMISVTLELIEKKIKDQLLTHDSDIYKSVMSDFLNHCSYYIHEKFSQDLAVYFSIDKKEDKLEFNLQQEELASLLYIINSAGLINTIDYNDTSFLRFCTQYFYFKKKNSYQKATSIKTLTDKYREIIRETEGSGLRKIKKKLMPILNQIIIKKGD